MPTRILVVHDKPEGIDSILVWLRIEGYEPIITTLADPVMTLAEGSDLILLDTTIASATAIEVARSLRRTPSTARIPIVLITNRTPNEAQVDMINAGANGLLTWPIQTGDLRQRLSAILNVGKAALDDNRRLLEETCQAALAILPCDLAWLLIADQAALHSRAIATDQGGSTNTMFLRIIAGTSNSPQFPLVQSSNPISEVALGQLAKTNVPVQQLQNVIGGKQLYRALTQLRLTHIHFLPLKTGGQVRGMMVLAARQPHDMISQRGQQILNALINQAATVVDNARLVTDLAAREEQMRVEQSFRKMVLDTMGDGLIVLDDQGSIRYVNNRLLRMSGYTRQELYGTNIGTIFHPSGRERLVTSLKRQGRTTVSFSQQLVTKNGRSVPVLMSRATGSASAMGDPSTVLVLTDLTEQKRREQALERQSEHLRTLNRAAQAVTSALTLDDVIVVLLQSAAEVVQCTTTCLYLKNDDSETFSVVAAVGPQAESLSKIKVRRGEGIAGEVVQTQRPQLYSAIEIESNGLRAVVPEGSSVIAVPLIIVDQVIGVLEAINKIDGEFTKENIEILENLAAAASVAIENARLFEQAQRRVNEVSTMLEASAAVSSTLEIGNILELIARRLAEALTVARCSIAAWDRGAKQLVTLSEVCKAQWEPGKGPIRALASTAFGSSVLQTGKASFATENDFHLDPQIKAVLSMMRMRTVLVLALRVPQGTTVGMIELYSNKSRTEITPAYIQMVEDSISRWRERLRRRDSGAWYEQNNLIDLHDNLMRASDSSWCVISTWERRESVARSLREVGFALWSEEAGVSYKLDAYPTMAASLQQGLPMVLYPTLLVNDTNERKLMTQAGMSTGLIIPLLVRGEASGLVKLLDINEGRSFDIEEISLCQGIANVVGNALENAQLYQSLERRANALQAAYDELQQADKVKDDLIQNLSHELGTPLSQTLMQLDLIANDFFGPVNEEQKQNMQEIMNKVANVGTLIHDMVSLHAVDIHKLDFAEVQLSAVIETSVRNQSAKATKAGLTINVKLPPNLPKVWADAARLVELLDQLLDNAIKFSPKSDRANDSVDMDVVDSGGAMLHLSVQDYGIGIPEDEFERIFHRGYQVDGSMTRRFGGTGLGLALARQIAEAHGGKLWVESRVGAGSQFHFTIPKIGVKFPNNR